jgi:hypothetical protein
VQVDTINRSMVCGSSPALSSAARPAWVASVAVLSPGPANRRSRIPVRSRIHSSEVSTIVSK